MRFLILDTLAGTALPALVSECLRPRPVDQSEGGCFGRFMMEYRLINIPCHVIGPFSAAVAVQMVFKLGNPLPEFYADEFATTYFRAFVEPPLISAILTIRCIRFQIISSVLVKAIRTLGKE